MAVHLMRFADGLTNVVTGLGTQADAGTHRLYCQTIWTPELIANAYSGSGMLRKAVKVPADDMTREWRDWQAEKQQIEDIEAEETRLNIRAKVRQATIWRALGGAALILGLPGNPDQPARPDAIGKGGLAFVNIVSRVHLAIGERVDDPLDPLYGQPAYFRMTTQKGQVDLHPSRVIAFRGDPLPPLAVRGWDDEYWGEASAASLIEYAMNLDEAIATFRALIKDALNLDIGVPKLLEMVSTPDGEATLMRRLALMRQGTSAINANVFDAGDAEGKGGEKIERHQVAWTGIPEIIRVNAEALSAAADIPMTRLWGKAAEGMNASGDSQQRDWNKMVAGKQKNELQPTINPLDDVLIRSALGSRPAEIWAKWSPLDTPTEGQEADRFDKVMTAIGKVADTATIPSKAFAKATQNTLIENGWMPGLEAALDEIPESERYGLEPEPDLNNPDDDPSALQSKGGDQARGGSGPYNRATRANDAAAGIAKGDWVEFDSDSQTEKGPSSGKVIEVDGDKVTISHSDDPGEVFSIAALKVKSKGRHRKGGTVWVFDASPRPTYAFRQLLNAGDVIDWAKANGFESTLPASDMHVTVLYSRSPVDLMKMGRDWREDEKGQVQVRPGGPRVIERLGENAVVLRFASPDLEYRHRDMIEAGGSHDWEEYAPHVTLSYAMPAGVDLDALKPFNGVLRFGPEIFEALDLDLKLKVTEE